MRRILSWFIGLGIGSSVGALVVMLFVPTTAEQVRKRLSAGYADALETAYQAGEARKKELEAELARLRSE